MRKLVLFFIIFLFISFSCGKENSVNVVEKPSNLIEKDKMIDVLVDFHLAEIAIKKNNRAKADYYSNLYYYSLFKKHNIEAADFDSSIAYYIQMPEKFDAMYADVIEELEKLDTELSIKKNNKQKVDTKKIKEERERRRVDENDKKGSGLFKKIKKKALKNAKEDSQKPS